MGNWSTSRLLKPRMLRILANRVGILALLAMFFASSAGHHLAMAADFSPHHTVEAATYSEPHAHQGDPCSGSDCKPSEPSCWVMGQCMLGLAPSIVLNLLPSAAAVRHPAAGMILAAAAVELPLRPPTA